MAQVLMAQIGNWDFGPTGQNMVVAKNGLKLNPATKGKIGTATLTLLRRAGSPLPINPQMPVKIWLKDTVANRCVWGFFIGTVARRRKGRIPGTNILTWILDLQDANTLWHTAVTDAAWAPALHLGSGTFQAQIAAAFAHFTTGADIPTDAVSQVPDLFPGLTLAAKDYQGQDVWDVLLDIFARARAVTPTVYPAAAIVPDPSIGAVGGGMPNPVLSVWDEAAAFVPRVKFSDIPDVSHKAILQDPEFAEILESATLVNWRQSVPTHLLSVFTGDDPTSRASYPNPFNGRHGKAWQAKPLKDDVSTTNAAAQAVIDKEIKKRSNPRQTVAFATFEPVYPNDKIAVSWSLFGWVDAPFLVTSVTVNFEIQGRPVYVVEAGARLLEIGEADDDSVLAPPNGRVAQRPEPPGAPVVTANVFQEPTGRVALTILITTESPTASVDYYRAYITAGGIQTHYNMGKTGGVPNLAYTFTDLQSQISVSIVCTAIDVWGMESDFSSPPLVVTTASPPSPNPPQNVALNLAAGWAGYSWDANGANAGIKWDAPVGGPPDHYDIQWYDDIGHDSGLLTMGGGATGVWATHNLRSVLRHFRIRSVTQYGYHGNWATLDFTPPPANPRYPNGLAKLVKGYDQRGWPFYAFKWTIPPPTTNTYNGTPVAFRILVYDQYDQGLIYATPDLALTQQVYKLGFPLNPRYTYWARIQTKETGGDYGDRSPRIALNLSPAPTLPFGMIPTFGAYNGDDDSDQPLDYWAATVGPAVTPETTDTYAGLAAGKVSALAAGLQSRLECSWLAVKPGMGVKTTIAVKTPTSSGLPGIPAPFSDQSIIRWLDAAGVELSTVALNVPAPALAWAAADYTATVPAGAAYAVLRLAKTNTGAGPADLLWQVTDWDQQATTADYGAGTITTPAIAPANVIPSKMRVGSIENAIPNGSLEIPNEAGTGPDGFVLTGQWEWVYDALGGNVGDGSRAIKLGYGVVGTATIETPRFEFTGGTSNILNYGIHFAMAAVKAGGGTVDYIRAMFYDKDGVFGDYVDLRTNDNAANLATLITPVWGIVDGMVPPGGVGIHAIPTKAVAASIKISYTTSGLTQSLTVDRLEAEYGGNAASFGTVQIRLAGLGGENKLAATVDAVGNPRVSFWYPLAFTDVAHSGEILETIGSSNPGSPSLGQRHYRTDLHFWIYWDGTRWLTEEEYEIGDWTYYIGATVAAEISASQEYRNTESRDDYAYYLTRARIRYYVNGTLNGSNYWKIHWRSFTGLTILATHDLSGGSGTTWQTNTKTSFLAQPGVGEGIQQYAEKFGSPGALRFYSKLIARLIIT